ncbi:MAG: tRNA pseudouridine(55) synthase TruB [Armatimonadota bacterium]|nr:tRNA pseudouridine(55) synthase TruB [Armatimonadota bacterium]
MDGVLNINKPQGPTSHDVVALVRSISGEKRVGHAGTLDPMASGVLLVCLGNAVRIIEYLVNLKKVYRATAVFGAVTDTEDATGKIIEESDASYVTEAMLRSTLEKFTGKILQTPPMISAVRYKGRKLYELARAGKILERNPRIVEIYSLKLVEFQPGRKAEAVLEIECSKGTYIRTLCADIGRELSCGGYMKSLIRTAIGHFKIQDSISPSVVEELASESRLGEVLFSIDEALADMPSVIVNAEDVNRIANGAVVYLERPVANICEGNNVKIKSPEGCVIAIGTASWLSDGKMQIKPLKVFIKK